MCWKNGILQAMAYKDKDLSNLIPDYCNDRLEAEEKADFERRLREDQDLQDECRDFQEFRKLYREIDPVEPEPSTTIFDQITARVSTQQTAEKKEEKSRQAKMTSTLTESLLNFWQQCRESMSIPWMLAAAQAVVIVFLLIPMPRQNTYTTLSSPEVAANADKISINVVFQPKAMESDIRSLLHSIEGSVSSGPSSEGRYVVTVSGQNDLEKIMQTLKQSESVLFAEPVY